MLIYTFISTAWQSNAERSLTLKLFIDYNQTNKTSPREVLLRSNYHSSLFPKGIPCPWTAYNCIYFIRFWNHLITCTFFEFWYFCLLQDLNCEVELSLNVDKLNPLPPHWPSVNVSYCPNIIIFFVDILCPSYFMQRYNNMSNFIWTYMTSPSDTIILSKF